MKKLVAVLVALFPFLTMAQQPSIPESVLDGISKDLAKLQRMVVEVQGQVTAQQMFRADEVKITGVKPTVRLGATQTAAALFTPKPGQTFQVIDKTEDWYAIRLLEPVQGFSSGWVSAAEVVPTSSANKGTVKQTSFADDAFRQLTEQAAKMRDSYRNNPYVAVSGFAVNVGIPPSVSINFEFKK